MVEAFGVMMTDSPPASVVRKAPVSELTSTSPSMTLMVPPSPSNSMVNVLGPVAAASARGASTESRFPGCRASNWTQIQPATSSRRSCRSVGSMVTVVCGCRATTV